MDKQTLHTKDHLINGIDPYDFTKESCGKATLYSREVPWSSVVHIRFLFNFGAMHDKIGKEGTAHFLEHMIFTGNPLYKDKFEIDQFSKRHTLDSLHAFTSFSCVSVHFKCLVEHTQDALEGVYQMIRHSHLTESNIQNEMKIITQEAWGRYTNNTRIEYIKKETENLYYNMPDRLRISSPLGWPETIPNITKEDLIDMRDLGFTQENLSVIIAGALTPEVLDLARQTIQKLPVGSPIKQLYVPKQVDQPHKQTWIYTQEQIGLTNTKQSRVVLAGAVRRHYQCTDAVKILTSDLLYELLFQQIRHKNSWCYKVSADFGNAEDMSFGEISTVVDPEHTIDTIKIMREIIQGVLADTYIKEFEQEKQLRLERKYAAEITTDDIASYAVREIRFSKKIQTRKETFKEIEDTQYEDIKNLLLETFKPEIRLTEAYIPNEYSPEDLTKAIQSLI